jgi:prepilin-type N-terminal cleavage/methylation domain-containing protein
MNNKGFSLVELLAVITIISVIAILGVVGYTRYIDYTRHKAYDTMAKSAANAAAEYNMDYIGSETVTLAELTEGEYLEFPTDPSKKGTACTGTVETIYVENNEGLDEERYEVSLHCVNYEYKYCFPGGKKVALDGTCPTE